MVVVVTSMVMCLSATIIVAADVIARERERETTNYDK